MESELPIYTIEGTDFYVDVNSFRLTEVGNPENVIACTDMADFWDGYRFDYNKERKNIPGFYQRTDAVIALPGFTVLDPEGMAKRFCISIDQVKATTDFDLLVDPVSFDLRVNKGVLPTLTISGHIFYVDIRMDMLRPKDDFLSGELNFPIENYYDEDKRTYTIPYNPKTHEFQEPDYRNIKGLPKDIITVEFPSERLLDRIGWNRKYGFDMKHGLRINGLAMQFEARHVPWKETFLVDLIKSNRSIERKREEQRKGLQQMKEPQQPGNKGRRM